VKHRILFISATRIGDAVLSTGLLRHLLDAYPDALFTVACGPVAEGVFARMPRLERLILVPKRRYDLHWWALWRALVGTRWELAVDLRGSALTLLLPARRRAIMRGGRRPGHRLTHLAGALNLAVPPLPIAWIAPDDHAAAAVLLPPGETLIALCPTANVGNKIWPAERFIALNRELVTLLPGARTVIFGGPGKAERAAAAPVVAAIPGAIDLVGQLTLPQAAACLVRCALFVGNDSGLTHLAASTGIPTLSLFGPTSATEYAPAGPNAAAVLADGPPGAAPMTELAVATVARAAAAILAHAEGVGRPAPNPLVDIQNQVK
jgi:ADP-heptose:LPS heptosyltransferase